MQSSGERPSKVGDQFSVWSHRRMQSPALGYAARSCSPIRSTYRHRCAKSIPIQPRVMVAISGSCTCSKASVCECVGAQLCNTSRAGLIRGYQLTLSPFVGGQCRFYPTCSHYAAGNAGGGGAAGLCASARGAARSTQLW